MGSHRTSQRAKNWRRNYPTGRIPRSLVLDMYSDRVRPFRVFRTDSTLCDRMHSAFFINLLVIDQTNLGSYVKGLSNPRGSYFPAYSQLLKQTIASSQTLCICITTKIATMSQNLQSPPPETKYYILSFPKPQVLLVTINRAKQRNSLPSESHWEAHRIFTWFDHEPSLLVAVVTGAGDKAFCAGQDLTEQNSAAETSSSAAKEAVFNHPPTGFMGLSQRRGKKPVIAAVNGFALGGGFEICLNWYALFAPYYLERC